MDRKHKSRGAPVPRTLFAWSPHLTVRTRSLPEQIAEQVGNAIIQGRSEPGQRIQEQELADAFAVSRGPVREALRILERDGLVQINARRGAQVTQLDIAEIRDIFEVRKALLGLAARLAALRKETAFLSALKAGIKRLQSLAKSSEADPYVSEVYQLNLLMADASGNAFLRNMVFSLAHQTLRYARLGLATVQRRRQSAQNWTRLAASIEKRDAHEAQLAAERLVDDSREMAVKLLRDHAVSGRTRSASARSGRRSV